ncbi:hypothetical protein CEXT_671251 [Caerostris extrusa]|uniref:Uncharacterized protein n=1 Tax=Caerostris extrusa TaxID=172846 RepID=A0AAV4NAR8_CAEEX|nr:hypothetical protein CEXT_671251 [Caerostris extrusa]
MKPADKDKTVTVGSKPSITGIAHSTEFGQLFLTGAFLRNSLRPVSEQLTKVWLSFPRIPHVQGGGQSVLKRTTECILW